MGSNRDEDKRWMGLALEHARLAALAGEVPVGAVMVKDGKLLAAAGNAPIENHDPTGHAEIRVIRKAAQVLKNYRLPETTLYVSLEPCSMCAGAILHARVQRLVFAASDPRTGAAGSLMNLLDDTRLNHRVVVDSGLYADKSALLLRQFFRARRQK